MHDRKCINTHILSTEPSFVQSAFCQAFDRHPESVTPSYTIVADEGAEACRELTDITVEQPIGSNISSCAHASAGCCPFPLSSRLLQRSTGHSSMFPKHLSSP